jgi:hypothetical protein
MEVQEFWKEHDLASKSHVDKIVYLAMYAHLIRGLDRVVTGDVRRLFEELHLQPPNVSYYLKILSESKNKRFIRDKKGFRVEGRSRRRIEDEIAALKPPPISPIVESLADKFKDGDEAKFYAEAIASYKSGSFRSCIVMLWCLTIAHIINHVLSDPSRLSSFNSAYKARNQKNPELLNFDDFLLLKEFELLEIAQSAKIITKNAATVAKEKLRRRNMAAHPSPIVFTQLQVDEFATDVVNNLIAKI